MQDGTQADTPSALPEHVDEALTRICEENVRYLEQAADDIRAGLVLAVRYMLKNQGDYNATEGVVRLLQGLASTFRVASAMAGEVA